MTDRLVNVVIAGLGGQGVIKASDILAQAAFLSGEDVKKAEVHGMSQRGGSVTTDVRFGNRVLSPMIPDGEADFLVVLEETQVDAARYRLRTDGVLLTTARIPASDLPSPRTLNVAMLGLLSRSLSLPESAWMNALRAVLPERLFAMNAAAFRMARSRDTEERP